ncbi:hypothetical protein HZA40_00100 [Candidatus Peregrinibacteria bacterium]|nr:hypothetical protein [Candidatus Peregrinibacteria bacterium]
MDIHLSWDLFIIVFFVVIVAYSLIIGRDNTLKVILGTYVAALSADAGGSIFGKYFSGSEMFLKILKFASLGTESAAVVFMKVLFFVGLVILFAVKGAFFVQTNSDRSGPIRLVISLMYAVMSAGLIVSVILVFVSGVSFVGGGNAQTTGSALWTMYSQSTMVKSIVGNSYFWFSVPALAFLIQSIYNKKPAA